MRREAKLVIMLMEFFQGAQEDYQRELDRQAGFLHGDENESQFSIAVRRQRDVVVGADGVSWLFRSLMHI